MFKCDAELFFKASDKVDSANSLIKECVRDLNEFDLSNNESCKIMKQSINNSAISTLVSNIEKVKKDLFETNSAFKETYMALMQDALNISSIDVTNLSDFELMEYNKKFNSNQEEANRILLDSLKEQLKKLELAGADEQIISQIKEEIEYREILVEKYAIQDKMSVLSRTSDEYLKLFDESALMDVELIKRNKNLTEEERESAIREYNENWIYNVENILINRDIKELEKLTPNTEKYRQKENQIRQRQNALYSSQIDVYKKKESLTEDEKKIMKSLETAVKSNKSVMELNQLYFDKEENNGFFNFAKERQIDNAILDKKIEIKELDKNSPYAATEDEIAYKNMSSWDKFLTDSGTHLASTYSALCDIPEGIIDTAVTLAGLIPDNREWASEFVSRDLSGELYEGIVLSTGMNSYSAYGTYHTAGEIFGNTLGKIGVSFAAPWASAFIMGTSAMGNTAETALNSGDTYETAFVKSIVGGIGGAAEGYGLSKLNSGITDMMKNGGLKNILHSAGNNLKQFGNASFGVKDTLKFAGKNLVWNPLVETLTESDALIETGCVLANNVIECATTGDWDMTKLVTETGAVFLTNLGMNTLQGLAFNIEMPKTKTKPNLEFSMDDLSYQKVNGLSASSDYLKSNLRKYVYVDTSTIDGLNDSLSKNGMYHFTDSDVCDKILDSGYVKASGVVASYGNKKSFFFNDVPEVGAFASNLDALPIRTTAVKVMPGDDLLNNKRLKVRSLDDQAITYDGNLNFDKGSATKEYFILAKENDKLVYKSVPKEIYDNFPNTPEGKMLNDLLTKDNINTIKKDYFHNMTNKATEANVSTNVVKSSIEVNLDDQDVFAKYGSQTSSRIPIKSLDEQISMANYHTSKGRFSSIEIDSFDGITKEMLDKIDDPSSITFRMGDKTYTYLDVKQQIGLVPTASSVAIKSLDSKTPTTYHTTRYKHKNTGDRLPTRVNADSMSRAKTALSKFENLTGLENSKEIKSLLSDVLEQDYKYDLSSSEGAKVVESIQKYYDNRIFQQVNNGVYDAIKHKYLEESKVVIESYILKDDGTMEVKFSVDGKIRDPQNLTKIETDSIFYKAYNVAGSDTMNIILHFEKNIGNIGIDRVYKYESLVNYNSAEDVVKHMKESEILEYEAVWKDKVTIDGTNNKYNYGFFTTEENIFEYAGDKHIIGYDNKDGTRSQWAMSLSSLKKNLNEMEFNGSKLTIDSIKNMSDVEIQNLAEDLIAVPRGSYNKKKLVFVAGDRDINITNMTSNSLNGANDLYVAYGRTARNVFEADVGAVDINDVDITKKTVDGIREMFMKLLS